MSLEAGARLKESLVESNLPFKVDIVDWARMSKEFREIVTREGVLLSVSKR